MSALPLGSVPATTVAEAIASALRGEIAAGRLSPGQRLHQVELANQFGVSTTPVREALAILRHEGLVRVSPQRGARVFAPSITELKEQYEIRTELEALAVRHAALNFQPDDAPPFERLLDEMRRSTDSSRYVELNHSFHMNLYRLSNREQLVELIDNLRRSSDAYLQISATAISPSGRVHDEHAEILSACKNRDDKRAASAVRQHLAASVSHIIEVLPTSAPQKRQARRMAQPNKDRL